MYALCFVLKITKEDYQDPKHLEGHKAERKEGTSMAAGPRRVEGETL
jgi:hypothetical protein